MAIVGSRMVLGGVAGSQGNYGITFSYVNEHRLGWDAASDYAWTTYALLGDTPGKIVTIQEITALAAAVYKEDAIYHCVTQAEFLGQNAPFRFELIKSGIAGPCSQLSVVRMLDGRQAYIATDGGVYVYDGVNPIDTGRHLRKAIQQDLDEYNLGPLLGHDGPLQQAPVAVLPDPGRAHKPGPHPAGRSAAAVACVACGIPIWVGHGGLVADCSTSLTGLSGASVRLRFGQVPDALGDFASGLYEISIARHDNTWYKQQWQDDGDLSPTPLSRLT